VQPPFSAIDHVQLAMPAGGETAARAFYGVALGMREIQKPPALAARGGAWFESGPVVLHLGVETTFAPAKKAHPAVRCHDFEATLRRLREHGFDPQLDDAIEGVRRAFVHDPFGNRLELIAQAHPR
jgi:catechol 2,3-dioxygenase-like lactoylglutathione lyase family enzyme